MVHDLYQEIILDHSKRPRNCHPMADATRQADGYNPLCGDKVAIFLEIGDRLGIAESLEGLAEAAGTRCP